MIRAALLTLALSTPASAATVAQFVPGAAPCGDRCTYEWALAETGAPRGEPRPMVMPAGAVITHMAYAGTGEPRMLRQPLVNAADQGGIGYCWDAGCMMRVSECGNWAIYRTPHVAPPPPAFVARELNTSGVAFNEFPFSQHKRARGSIPGLPGSHEAPASVDRPTAPETIAPVPLPAGAWLLICALALLPLWRMTR